MRDDSRTDRKQFIATGFTAMAACLFRSEVTMEPQMRDSKMPPLSMESLYSTSVSATSLTGEAADRVAIRELIDAWAYCADRRLAERQAALFTPDGMVVVYEGDSATHKPTSTLRGHAEIISALGVLNKYGATTHFNGQSDILIQGERAIGESYCLAHQLWEESGQRKLQILAIRYRDKFAREGNRWLFAERQLIIDWSDTRPSVP